MKNFHGRITFARARKTPISSGHGISVLPKEIEEEQIEGSEHADQRGL